MIAESSFVYEIEHLRKHTRHNEVSGLCLTYESRINVKISPLLKKLLKTPCNLKRYVL
jgi:hypothetical protein